MPRHWHAATVKPGRYDLANRELIKQGYRTFSPRVRFRIIKPDGSYRYRIRPYLPGYILVQFDPVRSLWGCINSTRGVSRLLMTGEVPSRIRRGVVEAMLRELGGQFAVDERRLDELIIRQGDQAAIRGEAFEGIRGEVIHSSHTRVGMMLEMFGRQVRATASRAGLLKVEEMAA